MTSVSPKLLNSDSFNDIASPLFYYDFMQVLFYRLSFCIFFLMCKSIVVYVACYNYKMIYCALLDRPIRIGCHFNGFWFKS